MGDVQKDTPAIDRRNDDAPAGFKDRFGDTGRIAARGFPQVRRISASALAAPAKGGSVRRAAIQLGGNQCPLLAHETNG
ncbi:MAG: hypothetical protein HKP37_09775 [Boseongicola sp.]|nr:hypothetical protein [Boseongicola sp.]